MINSWPILSIITFLPLCGAFFTFFISNNDDVNKNTNVSQNIKFVALWTSLMTFVISLLILINFDYELEGYQFE